MDVRKIRDKKAELPEAANARVKALRQLFKWAIEADEATSNPAKDVPYLKGNLEGFHTWTVEEVEQYKHRHPRGTKARKALAILALLGVRRSDAVQLGPQMENAAGTEITFVEAKGRNRAPKKRTLPILPELRAELDASPSGQPRLSGHQLRQAVHRQRLRQLVPRLLQ